MAGGGDTVTAGRIFLSYSAADGADSALRLGSRQDRRHSITVG